MLLEYKKDVCSKQVLYIMTSSCHMCKTITPFVKMLSEDNKDISFYIIDCDDNDNEITLKYNIKNVPAFIMLNEDKTSIYRGTDVDKLYYEFDTTFNKN